MRDKTEGIEREKLKEMGRKESGSGERMRSCHSSIQNNKSTHVSVDNDMINNADVWEICIMITHN